jgi:hypothetical protein
MFRRSTPATVPQVAIGADEQHDVCLKCGRPTPLGVSLCENDNPGRIKSPSTTQVHATILIGVLIGFVGLLAIFRLGATGVGPFHSSLLGYSTLADGGIQVAFTVTNGGTRQAGASCRISSNGAPDFRDYFFFTEPLAPGETRTITQEVPPAPDTPVLAPVNLTVNCG